jgi:putative hydrolase of the HAD superfamily
MRAAAYAAATTSIMIEVLAFDADDTLWHNERLFRATQKEYKRLLSRYHDDAWVEKHLYETEVRNLEHYGYGIKAFVLSMVETAVELTEGRVTGAEIRQILDLGRGMLTAPIGLLDGVDEILTQLADAHTLMIITKGDLLDQETKIERSGLRDRFRWVEVVSRKDAVVYERILSRYGIPPERFCMVGDSIRSDVLPVLEIGGTAIHIPHDDPWQHEVVQIDDALRAHYLELASIRAVPDALRTLTEASHADQG